MDSAEAKKLILQSHGVRVEDRTAAYAAGQLQNQSNQFPIMGGDARTGVPVLVQVDPNKLSASKKL